MRAGKLGIFTWVFLCCNIQGVKPFKLLGQALAPDGTPLQLVRRDDEYLILADGAILMSSRTHGSEEELANLACRGLRTVCGARVLIGGLGMGFTLRATLERLAADAKVLVAELVPAVVEWNRQSLGALAGHPLKDRRVQVATEDVAVTLQRGPGQFHAVLLDVDNGPAPFTASRNAGLYDRRGVAALRAALKKDGVLAVWAAQQDAKFARRLREGGFAVQVQGVRGRLKKGGRHTLFLARKS
ncbi:MAG: hypothetical protein ABSG16_20725 [Candidatus Acidiferrum sp.]|jgi:spermidine synthase